MHTRTETREERAVRLLKRARRELGEHNSEYHHHTPETFLAEIDAFLKELGGQDH